MKYLLYGANGYTAQLIIKESLKSGLKPVLAGRNKESIEALAKKHQLDYLIFGLDNPAIVAENLANFKVCINAAGPFSKTAKAMIEGCIASGTHYLDITGEIEVFEMAKLFNNAAKEAKVCILPGVGFDVVPSDCLANFLKSKLPDATYLELAFTSVGGSLSPGTASTMIENLGEGGAARVNGEIESVPLGHLRKRIDFGEVKHYTMTIPWGDVSTAYTSTGIPNIVVYTGVPKSTLRFLNFQKLFNPILRTSLVKKIAQKWVDKKVQGPSETQNKKGKSYLWGEVKNEKGQKRAALLYCKEGYALTALASVLICKKILNNKFKTGYQTPVTAYGYNLILEIKDSHFYEAK